MQIAPRTGISGDYEARSCWHPEPNLCSLIPSFRRVFWGSWQVGVSGWKEVYRHKQFGGILACTHHTFSCIRSQSPSMYIFVLWYVKYEPFYKWETTLLAWYLTISANPKSLMKSFQVFSPFLTPLSPPSKLFQVTGVRQLENNIIIQWVCCE